MKKQQVPVFPMGERNQVRRFRVKEHETKVALSVILTWMATIAGIAAACVIAWHGKK